MANQEQLDKVYMSVAEAHASLSKAKRKAVGAAIVTANGTILAGVNGLAPGSSNELEVKEYCGRLDEDLIEEQWPFKDSVGNRYRLVTKKQTIHAELNCILRAAREGVSILGGTLYVSLSPCITCSEMIAAAGLKRVVYKDEYRDLSGIENLKQLRILVEKINERVESI